MSRFRQSCDFFASLGVLLLIAGSSAAQDKPDVRKQIADAYGFSSWSQVEQIRYTFNVEAGKVKLARTWIWEPKADRVTFEGKDKEGKPLKVSYTHAQMTPDIVKNIDPDFINDQYWLVFPFHLVWDTSATVEDKGQSKPLAGRGLARKVTISYPKQGGYTPGDSYDLFVDANNHAVAWTHHEGGTPKPSLTTSWVDYKKAGPLVIALDHRGTEEGKPIRIFFTDVAVRLTGSDAWVPAQ
jgi:hypothetical protein